MRLRDVVVSLTKRAETLEKEVHSIKHGKSLSE
jgi:hypothetical protein